MQKQSGFGVIEIVVAVVVLAVLAGAGYLFVQQMDKKDDNKSNNNTSSEQIEHSEDHESMMENWKTHTSSTYGFSFKYPENWTVEEVTVAGHESSPNAIVKNAAGEEVLGVYGYLGIGCEEMPTGNEATEKVSIGSTEVTVAKDCNSNWNWITAKAAGGSTLTVTTANFIGTTEEEDAEMLLGTVTGLSEIMANSSKDSGM